MHTSAIRGRIAVLDELIADVHTAIETCVKSQEIESSHPVAIAAKEKLCYTRIHLHTSDVLLVEVEVVKVPPSPPPPPPPWTAFNFLETSLSVHQILQKINFRS